MQFQELDAFSPVLSGMDWIYVHLKCISEGYPIRKQKHMKRPGVNSTYSTIVINVTWEKKSRKKIKKIGCIGTYKHSVEFFSFKIAKTVNFIK